MSEQNKLLEIKDYRVSFQMYDRGLKKRTLTVVRNMNIAVHKGEIVAIVGASGSGKSVLAHAVLGLLPGNARTSGTILYEEHELDDKLRKEKVGTEIIMIPQSVTYLDPLMKTGAQVQGIKGSTAQRKKAFERYGLDESATGKYPFQLSGGMARRALISTAVITEAKLILADEPTPGLSEDLALETMQNFRELADAGKGILMITHDLDIALHVADTIAVFYDGEVIDTCRAEAFAEDGKGLEHPYTKALWAALPQNGFVPADPVQLMKGRRDKRNAER
ncbi:MAG: ABC transporter ATP-binding protein [Lachnospiraceae bacterium]|nr:ABC transporter ATP-binding protein [Lachnospiraceae bacterium]